MKNALLILLMCSLSTLVNAGAPGGDPIVKPLEYSDGQTNFRGTVATPADVQGKIPGVLIVPDWMGPRQYFDDLAASIAKMGYVAMVADVYSVEVRPKTTQEAAKAATDLREGDRQVFRERLKLSLDQLRKQPNVDNGRIAAIGYCFGGTGVLELARMGTDINGVVSFHGGLSKADRNDDSNFKCSVLVLHGSDDPYADWDEVTALKEELDAAEVDWQMIVFGGQHHSFTDPDANAPGQAEYHRPSAERSWKYMKLFFNEIFSQDRD